MTSSFLGLDIARRALAAQQHALNTVAHNTANANTPGYSRQEAVLVTTQPLVVPTGSARSQNAHLGTGVEVSTIRRFREAFLDQQYRQESLALGKAEVERDTLQRVESILNEPSDGGLQSLLSKFWAAWQELSNDPSNSAHRASLREQAQTLTDAFNWTSSKLSDLQRDLNDQIQLRVDDVNSLATRIAALNTTIMRTETDGSSANDLRDRRDLLVDELSRILPVEVVEASDGQVHLFFDGHQLVAGDQTFTLAAEPNAANNSHYDLTFDNGATFLTARSGQLGALAAVRDGQLQSYLDKLDDMANGLRDAVNAQHQAGFGLDGVTGRDFFDPASTGAGDFALDAAIVADLNAIAAASAAGAAADGSNALALADLQQAAITIGGSSVRVGDYYRSLIAELGVASQAAANRAANQQVIVEQMALQRQEASGVSLDEEAILMIQYQRAYQAAARVVTATDEMLEYLITRTGVAGR